jgi:hypothetical protein
MKKELILQGMGWGHMPHYLITPNLRDASLLPITGKHFKGDKSTLSQHGGGTRRMARWPIVCSGSPARRRRRSWLSLSPIPWVEKGEGGPDDAFQQGSLRSNAGKHAHAHEHAQEMAGELFRSVRPVDRTVGLAGLDTAPEEPLDPDQDVGDDSLELWIMWRNIERRVDQHAALALTIAERALDDFREEVADRLAWRQSFAAPDAVGNALVDVVVERLLIKRAFVAEGVVEAGAGDSRLLDQVPDRSRFVATRPEALDRGIEHGLFIEFPGSRHSVSLRGECGHYLAILLPALYFRTVELKYKARHQCAAPGEHPHA